MPTGAPGVAPLASAPRADWPCAKTVDSVGARITFDYAGAPESCWFPPDLWQPGCPTRHVQANPAMGIEIEATYRYDDRHRLVGLDSKLQMIKLDTITYDGDKLASVDNLVYFPAGAATHVWNKDGSLYAVVDHRDAGAGITRLRTSLDSPDAEPLTDEQYEYTGSRLSRILGKALGTTETHTYEYDCK